MTTHTTSTKCQYRPTISRPMKFPGLKRPLLVRGRQARGQITPTKTWVPWNPVRVRKHCPKMRW